MFTKNMSIPTKTQNRESMDLDEFNLTVRKLANKLNNSLIDLEFIVEKIEKMNNNERLELEKQHNNKSIRRI